MRTRPTMDALWNQAARYDRRLRLPRDAAQREALLATLAR